MLAFINVMLESLHSLCRVLEKRKVFLEVL